MLMLSHVAAFAPPLLLPARRCSRPVVAPSACAGGPAEPRQRPRSAGEQLATSPRPSPPRALALLAAALVAASAPPASAITDNQLLFLEAWRAVDKAYVDKRFAGQPWQRLRETTVKQTRMDTREATYDAIRGLLLLLGDPYTRFLNPDAAAALAGANSGFLTGVGVELAPDGGAGDVLVRRRGVAPLLLRLCLCLLLLCPDAMCFRCYRSAWLRPRRGDQRKARACARATYCSP